MKISLPTIGKKNEKKEQQEFLKEQEAVIEEMVQLELIDHILQDDDHLVELIIWAADHEEEILTVELDSLELLLLTSDDMYIEYTSEKTATIISKSLNAWKERHDFYENMSRLYEEKLVEKYPQNEMEQFKKDIEEKAKPMPLEEWTRQLAKNIIADDVASRDFFKKNARQMKGFKTYIDTEYNAPTPN